jgi:hypothetical protein
MPSDIKRENTTEKMIDLVVDERMTTTEAAEAAGIARSTWY